MNLRQLKSLCEVVDHGLSISKAAGMIYRSQSGVRRQLQELEKELGVDIFLRKRNRILQITPPGDEGFSGNWAVNKAFFDRELKPIVVLNAIDADVSKAYIEMGLGIAILVTIAFDAKRDINLRGIDA